MGTFLSLLLALNITGQERPQNSPPKAGPIVRFDVLIAGLEEQPNEPTAGSILELEKTGKLKSLQRLQLATLEQQLASVQIGQLVQRVSGQAVAAGRGAPAIAGRGFAGGGFVGGAAVPRFSSVNVGTTMSVTPRIENDGSIAAQLALQIVSLADEPQPAANADAAPPPPQGIDRLTLQTTLHLQAGEPQLISAKQNRDGKEGQTVWIVVIAHVGPPQ